MADPFASLDPIGAKSRSKSIPYNNNMNMPPSAPIAPLGMPNGGSNSFKQNGGMGQMPGMPGIMLNGGMGMGMNMNMNMNMNTGMGMGMGMGMNMGMGGAGGMPFGGGMQMNPQQQQQQQQQQPVMYDNIKNLLNQKPKVDSASLDFLDALGGGKPMTNSAPVPVTRPAEPTTCAVVDPFGPSLAQQPPTAAPTTVSADLDFGVLGGQSSKPSANSTNTAASGAGGNKSSALAARLANGRRQTQEAQRNQLAFNANSFANASNSPKISLKELGKTPTEDNRSGSFKNKTGGDEESEPRSMSIDAFVNGSEPAKQPSTEGLLW